MAPDVPLWRIVLIYRMRFVILGMLFLGVGLGCAERSKTARLSEAEIRALVERGTPVVDVRTPREYTIRHVAGSTNLPLDELEERIGQVAPDRKAPLIVHCQSGGRSAAAKESLEKIGYRQVIDLGSLAHAREVLEGTGR